MHSKFKPAVFVFLTAIMLFAVPAASAQGITYGDSVPAGQTIDDDLVLFGDSVRIQGKVLGDVIAIGREVEVSGEVEGSLIAIGQVADIEGTVRDSLYSMGLEIRTGPESVIGRSLYYLGLSLIVEEGSQIGRDLVAGTLGAQIVGEVGRGLRAVIGPLEILRLVMEAIGQPLQLRDLFSSGSSFNPTEVGLDTANVQVIPVSRTSLSLIFMDDLGKKIVISPNQPSQDSEVLTQTDDGVGSSAVDIDLEDVGNWILARIRTLVLLLVIGLLMLWLRPSLYTDGAEKLQTKPWISLGLGLLGLILAVNVLAVAGLLSLIVLLIGIWLGIISFWELAFLFWGIGFSSILLATTLFVSFAFFGTKAVVSYWVGTLILKPAGENALKYKALPLLIGLLIFVLLASIPILGWVLSIFVISLGLGATWLAWRERDESDQEETSSAKK